MPWIVSGRWVSSAMPPLAIAITTSPVVVQYAIDFAFAFMVFVSLEPMTGEGKAFRQGTRRSSAFPGRSKSPRLARHSVVGRNFSMRSGPHAIHDADSPRRSRPRRGSAEGAVGGLRRLQPGAREG